MQVTDKIFRFCVLFYVLIFTSCVSQTYSVESGAGGGKKWQDFRQHETSVITQGLTQDTIHDKKNSAISILQEPAESLATFPADRRGAVDWVKALDLALINPRESVSGEEDMLIMDMDILFTDTGEMPFVTFPHLAHTKWLDCSNCHPDIFIPQKGANNPSMDGILSGEHCGRCHGKVAFALWICERCHNIPHANSPKKWW